MSELLSALHAAGKINDDVVTTVNDFIEKNQLQQTVVNNPSSVSIA